MRTLLLLLCLLALPTRAATLSTTTCTSTVKTGCVILDLSTLNQLPSTVGVQLSGTWTGTVQFEKSINGSIYVSVVASPSTNSAWVTQASENGGWTADVAGYKFFRVRASELTAGTVTVDLAPSTARPMVDLVRAVGSTFGEVQVSGTTSLSNSTLGALGTVTCTQAEAHRLSLTTTPIVIPTEPPISGRTGWTVINVDSVKKVACRVDPGDGGVPDCNTPGFGLTAFPNGGTITFPVRESDTVRCVACTNGAAIEHTEEACVSPQ